MVTDHFNATPDGLHKFFIRGSSIGFALCLYSMSLLAANTAATIAFYLSAGVALLYPYNSKFNLFKDGVSGSLKYPMHYVPEVLMAALTLIGAYVVYL